MVPDTPPQEPSPEETVLQQAIEAIREEKFTQAREIMTKLLQTNQQNPEYWVWMSAAMETQKERLYCLQTAFKLDPTNVAARRGLTLMGALTQDEPLQPFPMNHPRPWEARIKLAKKKNRPNLATSPAFRLGTAIGLISLALISTFIWLGIMAKGQAATTPAPRGTPRPTVTPYATVSNENTPEKGILRPLAELLSSTYTPTPIYAATPHSAAGSDSFKAAMNAYKNGQWEMVGIMMAQVATSQPGSVDALYFIGESYRLSGNYQDAINSYKAAIAVDPKYAPSYLGRALASLAISPLNNVIDDLNMAIKTDSNYAEAYMQRGLYYLSKNDLKSAQADLEQASKLNDSPLVEINLARVLLAQQDNAAALDAAKLANQMDVTMLDSYLVLGQAYRANDQIDQAVNALETYIKYKPDNTEAFAILGLAYYNRGDYATAENDLQQSLRLGSNADAYFWLGQTYLAMKDYDNALENAQKARDLSPDSFDFSEGLAKVYMARGEYNNSYIAISKAEKLAETPDQQARFIFIRAQSLDQINEPDAAYRDWSAILNMPTDVTTAEMRQEAQLRMAALRSPTPSITPRGSPTVTVTPVIKKTATTKPVDTLQPSKTPTP